MSMGKADRMLQPLIRRRRDGWLWCCGCPARSKAKRRVKTKNEAWLSLPGARASPPAKSNQPASSQSRATQRSPASKAVQCPGRTGGTESVQNTLNLALRDGGALVQGIFACWLGESTPPGPTLQALPSTSLANSGGILGGSLRQSQRQCQRTSDAGDVRAYTN